MYTVKLNNGVEMPVLGLGVYKMLDADEMKSAVNAALEAGYRSFDTAQMYHNESLLGQVLSDTGIARKNIFLTSKVDTGNMGYQKTLDSFEESLEKLRTDYLDLFLVHWPGQQKQRLQETWKALEELCDAKKIRAIGVCNCMPKHIDWLCENGGTVPAVNQVERHPLNNEQSLQDWCSLRNIIMEAWAPLIRGNFNIPEITGLAEKYGKTPAQIILRWDIQSGYIVIPKSVHRERIFENAAIFDFEISREDMDILNRLDTGYTTSFNPETYDF